MAQQVSTPHFAAQSRTVLSGSEKQPVSKPGSQKPATPSEQLTVSVIVRRKKPWLRGTPAANNVSVVPDLMLNMLLIRPRSRW